MHTPEIPKYAKCTCGADYDSSIGPCPVCSFRERGLTKAGEVENTGQIFSDKIMPECYSSGHIPSQKKSEVWKQNLINKPAKSGVFWAKVKWQGGIKPHLTVVEYDLKKDDFYLLGTEDTYYVVEIEFLEELNKPEGVE